MPSAVDDKSRVRFERWIGGPAGFRRLLQRRGPIFVKIGQFLALRPDLIPSRYCSELMRLFDRVDPFPWIDARQIIREDLGAEPADLFSYIDSSPIAAGSLAQTYYARLPGGREVAVKVLRPRVREEIERDLSRARFLAHLAELSGTRVVLSSRDVVEEVSQWLRQEIDLRHELANIVRMRSLTVSSRFQVIPTPYSDLCGARVLTASFIRGAPVSSLLQNLDAGGKTGTAEPEQPTIDRGWFAHNLMYACLTQIFRYRFFHADLHPGNLIALRNGKIAFVDFGLCDEIDDTVRQKQMRYLAAIYEDNHEEVFRSLTEVFDHTEHTNLAGFHRDFQAETRQFTARKSSPEVAASTDAYESPVAGYMIGVLRAARSNGLMIPARILSMYRALLTAESVAHQIGSKVDLRSVGKNFFERLQRDEAARSLEPTNIERAILNYLSLWRDAPGHTNQILADMADGRFTLKVSQIEAEEVSSLRNRRTRVLVTSILNVALAVLIAGPDWRSYGVSWILWPLVALFLASFAVTFFNYRRLK